MHTTSHPMWRVVFEHVDEARALVNRQCSHLESWQIMSYTIAACFLVMWFRRMNRSDKPFVYRLRSSVYSIIRSLPWVKRRVKADLERARKEIEEEVHQCDQKRDFYKFLPEHPLAGEELLSEARQYAAMGERRYMEHYDPRTRNQDLSLCAKIYDLFSHSDPHRSDAFPGARKMEAEILRMSLSMFHGGVEACGVVAGAYRNRAKARGMYRPEIIAPSTAHPALDKAAALFGMTIRRVPVREDDRVHAAAVKRAIGPHTCMIVASAPNHITGTVDPIEKLSEVAQRFGVPLHVDCTLGGFLLPFMEYCDYSIPTFDFRLPGVTSIAIDLHRYGQAPRSCSVLMYRDASMMRHQCFCNSDWAGGVYATPTLAGGRDGGAVATAWATLLGKGRDGYINACHRVVETTRRLADLLSDIDGITLRGAADLCIVAFETSLGDIYVLVDFMTTKGWHVDPLLSPEAARVPVTLRMCEEGVLEAFVEDVIEGLRYLSENPTKTTKTSAFYHMLQTIVFVPKVADRMLVDELSLIRLQAHYSIPPPLDRDHRGLRALSVDGRKLSMLTSMEVPKASAEKIQ
ncbi:pyridoxal-dependent decarboxylase domain protein [Ancylostoma duodenale]|uniref:sphinganine-1-phosphate aldolase n=1 Tax=Ancylostoma duodenale TaxID=51022 RepID=A0A0C2DZY8_9BILA|nr:pyridoxal-dependent decarboxylase domain protein [Ancylostoma duodenale]